MGKINYLYNNAFLDLQYTQTFTELCKKKGIITKDILGGSVGYEGMPLRGVEKLLQYLVLFENIDFSSSIYDCSQLVERGIINEKSICCSNNDPPCDYEKQAVSIMSAYKSDIIRQNVELHKDELTMLRSKYSPSREYWCNKEYESINSICISKNLSLNLKKDYFEIINNLDILDDSRIKNNDYKLLDNILNGHPASNLFGIRNNLAYAFQSINENDAVFISNNLKHLQGNRIDKIVDDIYVLVQTSLPDDANILPMPTTLEDVWEMRSHPSISAFRKVMSEWNYYIQKNDINAAQKIKKDIIKANHNLKKIGKYKEFSSTPFVRTGLFLASFVPIVSEVLNVYSYVEPYFSDYFEKENNWTHLNEGII